MSGAGQVGVGSFFEILRESRRITACLAGPAGVFLYFGQRASAALQWKYLESS